VGAEITISSHSALNIAISPLYRKSGQDCIAIRTMVIARYRAESRVGHVVAKNNQEAPAMKSSGKQVPHTARAPRGDRRTGESAEGLLDQLFVWLDNSMVRQAAGELARECHLALWEATSQRAREMTRDAARSYIRDHAPEFLIRVVDVVLQRRRVRESLRRKILAEAAEQVVELVVKDLGRVKSRRGAARAA
jgi:hypothetical protein